MLTNKKKLTLEKDKANAKESYDMHYLRYKKYYNYLNIMFVPELVPDPHLMLLLLYYYKV